MAVPVATVKPGGASPIANNIGGQPTLPAGSIVDSGNGGVVTPTPKGTTGPADKALYDRVADVPTTPTILNNTDQAKVDAPLNANAEAARSAQDAVKNVNAVADKKLQDFASGRGASNVGSQNAIAALLGLSGAPGASDRAAVAGATDKKTNDAINAERANRIAAIYASLNKTTADNNAQYSSAPTFNADGSVKDPGGNVQQSQANIKAEQTARAKSVLTSLAGELGNVTYGQFKAADPTTYKKILDLAGGDDAALELLYAGAMKPPATKAGTAAANPLSQYHFGTDGRVYGPSTDGSGSIVERTDMEHLAAGATASGNAAPNGYVAQKMPDGNIYLFPKDAKGKAIYDPSKPSFGGTPLSGANGIPGAPPKKTTPTPAGGTPLTQSEYAKLNDSGVDKAMADKLTTAILKGLPLKDIREALRQDHVDPAILDYYDRTVGIQRILKNTKPSTAKPAAAATFGGGSGAEGNDSTTVKTP